MTKKMKFPRRDLPARLRAQTSSSSQTQGAIPGAKPALNYKWFFFLTGSSRNLPEYSSWSPQNEALTTWAGQRNRQDGGRAHLGTVTPSSSGTRRSASRNRPKEPARLLSRPEGCEWEGAAESWPEVLQSQWPLPMASPGSTCPFASVTQLPVLPLLPPFPTPMPARERERSMTASPHLTVPLRKHSEPPAATLVTQQSRGCDPDRWRRDPPKKHGSQRQAATFYFFLITVR